MALVAFAFSALPAGAAAASDRGIITFDTTSGIWAIHPDGSDRHLLIAENGAREAHWSPDGRHFVYTQYHDVNNHKPGWAYLNPVIVLASADGRTRRVLAPGEAPRFSADGRSILFAAPKKGNIYAGLSQRRGRLVGAADRAL